jgi:hypothetical protein
VPNLKTDRFLGMDWGETALNVRRLMYQSLIWCPHLGDQARRLAPALDSEDLECPADPLIDGMRGDSELDRNFLGGQVLVDKQQAIQLPLAEPADSGLKRQILAPFGRNAHLNPLSATALIDFNQHNRLFTAKEANRQNDEIAFNSDGFLAWSLRGWLTDVRHAPQSRMRCAWRWWRGLDSNQRTLARADLQSAAFNHSATSPGGQARQMAMGRCHVN